ncbi:hypothetical protein BTJ40_06730 [Microbulbifer sp. A4B17]|nr:hypothetical protein BTJ40_06730 [Microbulbifer sp. A4B17]
MLWLYEGVYRGAGRSRKYDGKVDFVAGVNCFEYVGILNDTTEVYTKVVYARFLKRVIHVVILRSTNGEKKGQVLLNSTDTEHDAMTLIAY